MKNLKTILQTFKRFAEAKEQESPLEHIKWLPPQLDVLKCTDRRVLYRTGNQYGKSTVGIAEVIYRCLGSHPYKKVRPAPIEAWIICATGEQSKPIQKKFWDLVPKHELKEGYVYDASTGFRANNPIVEFKNGSIVRFKTTHQKTLGLSGASVDFVLIDEPPQTERIYGEISNRLRASNGDMLMTLTPINADCDWLRALCELGIITDLHYRLDLKNMIPVGETEPLRGPDGTPRDALWIQDILRSTVAHEIPVTVHGEWDFAIQGRAFRGFKTSGPQSHIKEQIPKQNLEFLVGIDHGSGKQMNSCAILIGLDRSQPEPAIWVLDEYVSNGETTTKEDAKGIIDMLKRNGLVWSDLHRAFGDISTFTALGKKSNVHVEIEIAKLLGLRHHKGLSPRIFTAKKGQSIKRSIYYGWRYIHEATLTPGRFNVMSYCTRTIECLNKWDYTDNEYKHLIDAMRYALKDKIFPRAAYQPQKINVA